MTTIGSLLDQETATRLQQAVVANLDEDQPAKEVAYIVRKASTDPNPPRRLTEADAVDIDPRSDALIEFPCVDCKAPVLLDPQVPEGVDPEAPRVPICNDCAKVRTRHAAMNEQRNVEAIRRTRTAKHQPRTTDNIDHPVTTRKKETHMMDLDNMTDAELGAIVRKRMKAALGEQVEAARPEVLAERAQREAEHVEAVHVEQKVRKERVYAAFTFGNIEVPTLDLTDLSSLAETVTPKARSPYNKALYRLGEPLLDKEATTWEILVATHERLAQIAQEQSVKAPKAKKEKGAKKDKAKKAKPEQAQAVLAVTEGDSLAKSLASLFDISIEEAHERLASY